jgi:hypothetical protein
MVKLSVWNAALDLKLETTHLNLRRSNVLVRAPDTIHAAVEALKGAQKLADCESDVLSARYQANEKVIVPQQVQVFETSVLNASFIPKTNGAIRFNSELGGILKMYSRVAI